MFAAKLPNTVPNAQSPRVAVVGAGWAGCAAAVELARAGRLVTLFESTRTLGGRARGVPLDGWLLDNGQHILLGAYRDSLALMQAVGIDTDDALLRLPLQMRYPPGCGGMDFVAPSLPAPLHMLAALLTAKGLTKADKLALARFFTAARWMEWRMNQECSVAELLERFDQTALLIKLMWRPLCLAALNTPPERASAQVFLNVMRDTLGARRAASEMLLPRVNLTELFPQHAARFIRQHQGSICTGASVSAISQSGNGWRLTFAGDDATPATATHNEHNKVDNHHDFDGVVLATPVSHTAGLLDGLIDTGALKGFTYEPITTCYLRYPPATRLTQPFFALIDNAAASEWGQFVFDRGQLDHTHAGLLSVVVSAASAAAEQDQKTLAGAIAAQLAKALQMPPLAQPVWSKVISEKRATFSCTPGLTRPENASGLPGLAIAGDYTASDYPATLEAAVRSGLQA
ncbi:MAG: hydroxysqualene dehydroxylase HpnE, partial [Burkholderiales bacterium]